VKAKEHVALARRQARDDVQSVSALHRMTLGRRARSRVDGVEVRALLGGLARAPQVVETHAVADAA
jgi:hypothetical protein